MHLQLAGLCCYIWDIYICICSCICSLQVCVATCGTYICICRYICSLQVEMATFGICVSAYGGREACLWYYISDLYIGVCTCKSTSAACRLLHLGLTYHICASRYGSTSAACSMPDPCRLRCCESCVLSSKSSNLQTLFICARVMVVRNS